MKKLLRVLVVAALLIAIAIPCLADGPASTDPSADPTPVPKCQSCKYDNGVVTKDPTCTEKGEKTFTCNVCGNKYTSEIPANGHKWGEWKDVPGKAVTCGKDGQQERECSVCHHKETRTVEATGKHAEGVPTNQMQAPTCYKDGWKGLTKCPVCHTVLTSEVIPATGNHEYEEKRVDPTCGKDGYTTLICKTPGCNHEKEGSRKVIKATGNHNVEGATEIIVSEATCDQPKVVYQVCKVCKQKIEKKVGTKLGHNLVWTTTTPATCTEKGLKTGVCQRCDYTTTREIDALKHKPGTAEILSQATCTENSIGGIKCTRCKEVIDQWENKDTKLNHDEEVTIVEPTCDKEGTATTTCKRCKAVLKTETLKKLPHTYEWKVTKEPANKCDTTEETEICKVCGAKGKTRVIKGAAHEWSTAPIVAKQPTCTEKGVKAIACKVCGTVKEGAQTEEIPALGHKPGEYTQTKAPTCTEKGEEVSKCTVCNAVVDTREVAAKGHIAGEWITVRQPSASQNGKMIQKCTVCGAQIGKKYIRATGTADTAVKTVAYVAGTEVANYAKIDLTVDATTELDLVSANGTKVGKLVVEVKEGKVTVKYELSAVPADAFLTFVTEAPSKDIHAEKEFEFEKAISVADELAGAAAAYIYVEIEY